MQHIGIDGWEALDSAHLFFHTLHSTTHRLREVLTFVVARRVHIVAASGRVRQTPVSESHVVATSDRIVSSESALQQV